MKRVGLLLLAFTLFVGANAANQPITIHKDSVKEVRVLKTEKIDNTAKDSMLMEKLSAEQLMQLEQEKLSVERDRIEAASKEDMPLNGFGINYCKIKSSFFLLLIICGVRDSSECGNSPVKLPFNSFLSDVFKSQIRV